MFKKFIFIVLGCIFIQFNVFAEAKNSSVTIDIGKDEKSNSNSALTLDLGLENSKRFLLGFGKSRIPAGLQTFDSEFVFLGLSKEFTKQWKVTGMLEFSGLKNAFTILSTSIPVRYTQDSYYVELVPLLRRIKLTTLSNKDILASSTGLGVKSGLYFGEHFRLSGSFYSYAYSHDVSKLASFASARFFNVKTLLLSSGLLKRSYNLETGLDYDSFSVSLGKNRSVSAVDNKNSDYIYTVLGYYLSDTWNLSFLYGKYLNTPADKDNYSSLSVGYSF